MTKKFIPRYKDKPTDYKALRLYVECGICVMCFLWSIAVGWFGLHALLVKGEIIGLSLLALAFYVLISTFKDIRQELSQRKSKR